MKRNKISMMRLMACLFVVMTSSLAAMAQNSLHVVDFTAAAGKEVAVPIYLDNSEEVVGMQFDITLPYSKGSSDVTLVDARSNGHSVSLRRLSDKQYTVVVMSLENKALRGNGGLLLRFPVRVPDNAQADDRVAFGLSHIVLTSKTGHNVATTTTSDATFTVQRTPTPDFVPQQLTIAGTASTLVPGAALPLSFVVKNEGTGDSKDGWTEKIYVEDLLGTRTYVSAERYANTLAAGEQVSRQYEVTLPQVMKTEGTVRVYIEIVPLNNTDELIADQANNSTTSQNTKELEKRLFLSESRIVLTEGSSRNITLTRSGDWTADETFTLSEQNTHGVMMLSLPASVTIRKGQSGVSLNVLATENSEVNTQYRTGVEVTGDDYPAVSMTVDVEDNDKHTLTLTTDKNVYQEGEPLILTATIDRAVESDLKVSIANTDAGRFYPYVRSITIPAGKLSAQATTQVVDDVYPMADANVTFTAAASGYETSKRTIAIQDNDWPSLQATLSRTLISEADGYGATMATITRQGNLDANVTVYVSSNAGKELYFDSQYNVIPAGESSVTIPVSVEDNSKMEGQRTWTLAFAVCDAQTGRPVGQGSRAYATAQLTVTDNDADVTLKMQSATATLAAGGSAATVTMERNGTVGDLVVTLQSDDSTLELPTNVTIPAGKNTATFSVSAKAGSGNVDSHYARITASSAGVQSAQFVFLISSLADAVCGTPVVDTNEPFGGQTMQVVLPVTNQGTSTLPAGVEVRIRLTNDKNYNPYSRQGAPKDMELLVTATTQAVAPGETVPMGFQVTLPTHLKLQQYYMVGWLNWNQETPETNKMNNVSPTTPVYIRPSFSLAEISTDRDIYTRGNTIHFTGRMTNSDSHLSMDGREVDVYLINDTKRYVVTTTLDSNGSFAADYTFGEQTGGRYLTGACVSGIGGTETKGYIDVTRLQINRSGYLLENITEGVPLEGNISVTNLSEVPAYNVEFAFVGLPGQWTMETNAIPVLQAGATGNCHYRIVPTKPDNAVKDYHSGTFVVSGTDGNGNAISDSEMPVYFWNYAAKATLAANDVRTTLCKDGQRRLQLQIENGGLKETGSISVQWAQDQQWFAAAATQMASIAAGATATLELVLTGQSDMIVDGTYESTLRLKPENGEKIDVRVRATVVATDYGQLTVDVVDAYTLGADDGNGPHVGNAFVRLTNAVTGEVVMTGTTGSDGLFTAEQLKEGTYYVYATAANHYQAEKTITVNPGEENTVQVFLPYQVVKIEYTVERTTVTDEYKTMVTLDVVPDIPQAIVIPSLPSNWGTGTHAYSITLTNKGRLTAYTPYLEFPNVEGATFTVKSDYPAVIYPNESVDVIVEFSGPENVSETRLGYIVMHYAYKLQEKTYWGKETYMAAMGNGDLQMLAGGGLGSASSDTEGRNFGDYTPPSGSTDGGDYIIIDDGSDIGASQEPDVTIRDYSNSVDNRVRLQFEQSFFLEREAFKGNLKIENLQMDGIERITMVPNVKRTDGTDASDLFAIEVEGKGTWAGNDNWTLESGGTGKAEVLYVPAKETAPTEPVEYLFGGIVSYRDVQTGNLVNVELTPTKLTVNPSPDLHLTYFIQRDFISDDPLTEEVEPWEPAQFALLIQNKGAGDAIDLKIETSDPTIVQNDCGLPVEFTKLYSTVDGVEKNMNFNKLDLGRIAAGQNVMARWWYYSNVSAHVANYDVQMTKHSNYGVEFDLITLDGVRELTRSVSGSIGRGVASARRRAFSPTVSSSDIFLLNLIEDEDNLPDHVMDSDGNETDDLEIVSDGMACTNAGDKQYTLSVQASREGWVYGVIHDPTNCTMNLVRAVRNSDGADVTQNVWQTDRTVQNDYITIVDNRLHLADNIDTNETYTLYYEPKPAAAPKVKSIELVVEEGSLSEAKQAIVTFEEPIDETSVDDGDVMLLAASQQQTATVTVMNSTQVLVDWSGKPLQNGQYTLIVYTQGITNTDGRAGTANSSKTWTVEAVVTLGDVNGDGVVNVTDVMALSSHIMGKTPAKFVEGNADVNNSGSINITDIMGTSKIIMDNK